MQRNNCDSSQFDLYDMSLLLEHPVRVYMLAQPERTVRISRGRREDARQHEREGRMGRTGDAKYPKRAREREGAKEAPRGRRREREHGTAAVQRRAGR